MNLGKAFSYQFEDKQWASKLGLGGLITLVPILNFAWYGYMVDLIRNVADGVAEPVVERADPRPGTLFQLHGLARFQAR